MRERLRALALIVTVSVALAGCLGDDEVAGGDARRDVENDMGEATKPLIGSDLGHQAFQPSTRLVVPAGVGTPLDRSGRVLAGLAEGVLGVRLFVDWAWTSRRSPSLTSRP
jgi:hypothetical protein